MKLEGVETKFSYLMAFVKIGGVYLLFYSLSRIMWTNILLK